MPASTGAQFHVNVYRISVARLVVSAGALLLGDSCQAEDPFFVTYTSEMEDKGTLEINSKNITGSPAGGYWFGAMALEFEYGATSW